ncbi:MAG: thiolase family protein [Deltaproteobacteria bacterium]|nr:thiolase family protein [Deltaproteobacteria bacterium]
MEKTILASARRTPFGRYLGGLAGLDPVELAVTACNAALGDAGIPAEAVDLLVAGNCFSMSLPTASVAGRQLGLRLGIDRFSASVDTACCSPMTALRLADQAIRLGEADVVLVAGMESMSRVPHLARGLRLGVKAGAVQLQDPIFPIEYAGFAPVAVDAERGALRYGIDRAAMDAFAARSHRTWGEAVAAGRLAAELARVEIPGRKGPQIVDADEQPRPDTTAEALAGLKPIFGTASITAGNAPGLNDGAAAAILVSGRKAAEMGIRPLAAIEAAAGTTSTPEGMSWVPALALRAALGRAGRTVSDLDLIEINEAFAAVPLVSLRVLADGDGALESRLHERTNVNGGAVAIGHPVGASGLRLVATLAHELARRGGGLGAAAICGGLAQGEAVLVRVQPGQRGGE